MKPERKWQVVAGVSLLLFVLAAVVAVRQFHQIQLLRSAGPSLRNAPGDAGQTIAPANAPASAEADARSEQAIAQKVAQRIGQYHRDLALKRNQELTAVVAAQTKFLMSPDTQKRESEVFRANLKLRYGPFYAALGFSAEEIASFESVMMERFWVVSDSVSAARLAGLDDSRGSALRARELGALDARLHVLLGEERSRTLRDFDVSADARAVVEFLAGKIASANAPLSQPQIEQIVAMVAPAQQSLPKKDDWLKAAVVNHSSAISFPEMDWTKIGEDQLGFLSPSQRAIMSAFLTDVQKRQVIREDFKRVERVAREALSREADGK